MRRLQGVIMRKIVAAAILIGLFAAATPISGQTERTVTKLSEGVYEIEHRQGGGGNTTVIIGDRQVFVVDTCFLPSAAREDIAQIRQWTDKPVSFVLNTHFHNDHNFGNRIYMDAFPALTIIAQVETKKEMDRFGPGSLRREEKDSYGIEKILQKMLQTGKTQDGSVLSEDDKKEVREMLARRPAMIEELRKVAFQSATLTFDHDFSVDIGNREVQVKFLGRGNTAGDAVVYLPKEKILVVVNEKLRQTAPAMFQTLDDVKSSVDLSAFRQRFAGNDKDLGAAFDDVAARLVKLVFDEARLR
jgi:cyclase